MGGAFPREGGTAGPFSFYRAPGIFGPQNLRSPNFWDDGPSVLLDSGSWAQPSLNVGDEGAGPFWPGRNFPTNAPEILDGGTDPNRDRGFARSSGFGQSMPMMGKSGGAIFHAFLRPRSKLLDLVAIVPRC